MKLSLMLSMHSEYFRTRNGLFTILKTQQHKSMHEIHENVSHATLYFRVSCRCEAGVNLFPILFNQSKSYHPTKLCFGLRTYDVNVLFNIRKIMTSFNVSIVCARVAGRACVCVTHTFYDLIYATRRTNNVADITSNMTASPLGCLHGKFRKQ